MFFQWIRSRRRPSADAPPPTAAPDYALQVSILSDVGCLREVNEDYARCVRPPEGSPQAARGILALVADGMGGHAGGEIASRLAADVISDTYYGSTLAPAEALGEAFRAANRAIHEAARQQPDLRGMGTTCTALVLQGGHAFSAHVGDSRLYLLRRERLYHLSEDHSLVREMVRQGLLTDQEARHHEDKHVILRALGIRPSVEVAVWAAPMAVQPGDTYLLCSDGLYDLIDDDEIQEAMARPVPAEACRHLVALARARGGPDNITVGLLRLAEPGQAVLDGRATREAAA